MNKILGAIKQADLDFNLIESGDNIAIGLSYGKDSMVFVEALRLYKYFSKKDYNIIAININLGFDKLDNSVIIEYLKSKDIEFHEEISEPNVYEVLKLHIKNDKLPCSICSRMKKAALCKAAHKYNCNKIAFAHHNDDAIETLLLNAIYGGRIASFKPKTILSKENLICIRPMVYAKEKDITHTIKSSNIPILPSTCPNNKHTQREEMKNMLKDLYKKYPEAKNNFSILLQNFDHNELWIKEESKEKGS